MIVSKMIIGKSRIATDETINVYNPSNGELIGNVFAADETLIDEAVSAAKSAFAQWKQTTAGQRGALLRRSAQFVREDKESIARLMSMEQGKPFKEALGEVEKGADILCYYAEEGERVCGRLVQSAEGNNIFSSIVYQPVGVVAGISPWNYPIELMVWKLAASVAAGCCCVLKLPSETPLSPTAFIESVLKAGYPSGVINTITGSGEKIGDVITAHPNVNKIAFTGSTGVGKKIMKNSAGTLKRLSLELGGSLPMLVCEDCDIDLAVAGAVRRSFRNMGQICIAVNRIYVQDSIYDQFLEKFAEQTQKLTVGNPLEDDCDLGAMCTTGGIKTAETHISDAKEKGGEILCGGKMPEGDKFEKGNYFLPTIIGDANHKMKVMQEETFGPVVGVMPFADLDEGIRLANDNPYGLAAIVYTSNLSTALKASNELESGNVAVNNVDAGVINAPYGGIKESGFGHEHGPEGLYEYLNIKHIRIKF